MQTFSPSHFESVEPGPRKEHKRQILSSALACFDEFGIEATTVEAIRTTANSSVGSIYHHFGNKEGLIAALFFAALDDRENLIRPRIRSAETSHAAIGHLIHSYLEWVTNKPELARFLSNARHSVANGPHSKDLTARNKQRFGDLQKWLALGVENGSILPLPKETYASLLIGPSENFCRAWLTGRVKGKPTDYADVFADAAWRALASKNARRD